jgi:hypothetical protein
MREVEAENVGAGQEETLKHLKRVACWANRGDLLCIFPPSWQPLIVWRQPF